MVAAKATAQVVRRAGKGGGTSLPGLVAARVQPNVIRELSSQLAEGALVITGTNGKTTTSRMLANILSSSGYEVVRNASGSNLTRGIASALLGDSDLLGRLGRDLATIGLFEVDEAALPEVAGMLVPSRLVLNNLFRDQLDRYGEVATVARLWSRTLSTLPDTSLVIANADDPLVSDVALSSQHSATFFGLESWSGGEVEIAEHSSDVKSCPRCGGEIEYTVRTLGHLGHYSCRDCDFARPSPKVWADAVTLLGIEGSDFTMHSDGNTARIHLPLPGMYNVYNALAAAACAMSLGISIDVVATALGSVSAAFGRMERIPIGEQLIYLALAKNPAGLNEVLRTVIGTNRPARVLMGLNDNTADGRDVSWIWDADMELLAGQVEHAMFFGTRAADMALRFKYADVHGSAAGSGTILSSPTEALQQSLSALPDGGVLFIIPTYTAMLDVRQSLVDLGHVRPYWQA